MTKWNVNASIVITKLCVAHFSVYFCHMIAMLVVCSTMKTNIVKLEGEFSMAIKMKSVYCIINGTNLSQDLTHNILSS